MKKILLILLTIIMSLSIVACGNNSENSTLNENTPTLTDEGNKSDKAQPSERGKIYDDKHIKKDENRDHSIKRDDIKEKIKKTKEEIERGKETNKHNVLVVYYSGTGNTKRVAKYIIDSLDVDSFEIIPTKPYTEEDLDWTNEEGRVYKEHENEKLQNVDLVSTKVDNWEEYDVVLVGYPIWWSEAAYPVATFVKNNNFKDKFVVPFCTSIATDIGNSAKYLEELTNTGDWHIGYRFESNVTQDEVLDWIYYLHKSETL